MEIRIEQSWGYNLATREKQLSNFYWIFIDDDNVGMVGFELDSKVIFTKKNLCPESKQAVLDYIEDKLAVPNVDSVEVPDVDAMMKEFENDSNDEDFFDVSH